MKPTGWNRSRSGAALITTLVVVMIVVAAGAAVIGLAGNESYVVSRIRDQIKAQAIAEAGANEAYSILKADFSRKSDPEAFPETDFDGGKYHAQVITYESDSRKAHILCVASYGRAYAEVKCDVRDFSAAEGGGGGEPGDPPAPVGSYTYAIVSGGLMNWTGSGTMELGLGTGLIHAGGAFKTTGSQKYNLGRLESRVRIWSTGSTKINGNATTPVWKGNSPANVTGTKTTATPAPVALPAIDLQPYCDHADAQSPKQVYDSDQHFSGSADLVIPGGIMWVNGDFRFSGSGKIVGCVIATGDIDISGSGDQIKVLNYPALISRDGDIDISGSGKFHGLIYAMSGDFDKSGSGDVVGSIFCAGKFDKSGSWQVMNYENATPVPPDDAGGGGGGGGEAAPEVCITAWHR